VRELIRKMSRENPLWGAPRIHTGLADIDAETIVSIDFFTVPRTGSGSVMLDHES
jgi:hypothetical protein